MKNLIIAEFENVVHGTTETKEAVTKSFALFADANPVLQLDGRAESYVIQQEKDFINFICILEAKGHSNIEAMSVLKFYALLEKYSQTNGKKTN